MLNSAAGGAALSTLALIDEMSKQGVEASAVCHDAGTPGEKERLRDAVDGRVSFARLYWWNRKIRMPLWKRPLAELKQLLLTRGTLRSTAHVVAQAQAWHVDLIHTNTILTPEGGLAARRLALPHVWHLRELVGPGMPFRLPHEGPAFGRYLALYCTKLVANSLTSAARVRHWIDPSQLEIVPNGIDISSFAPRGGSDRAPLVVAMVGNLTTHWKKHALFVEAALRVAPELPVEFRIYGHDPSEGGQKPGDVYVDALHERIHQAGAARRFRWPGFVADPRQIMSEIDILVHPADGESFGRVVVEAMAAGLPVVGVRGGGVGELVEDGRTGLLAANNNAGELAAHVEELIKNPSQRQQLGAAGRDRALSHYSLAACSRRMLDIYEQAMLSPVGRAPGVAQPAPLAAH